MSAGDQARQGWDYIKARYGDPARWGGQLDWYDYPQDAKRLCPTPCDPDCDTDCHEWHQPRGKRQHQPDACPGRAS